MHSPTTTSTVISPFVSMARMSTMMTLTAFAPPPSASASDSSPPGRVAMLSRLAQARASSPAAAAA